MRRKNCCCALSAMGLFAAPAMAGFDPTFIFEDTAYLSGEDSPFDLFGPGSDFFLEDFEDGLLNSPGLFGLGGEIRFPSSFTDSVDGDDGLIDGFGTDGHSYWAFADKGGPHARFEFDAEVLGGLPANVGIVWTDGNFDAITSFEAFGPNGESLGIVDVKLGGSSHQGLTGDDRFFGVIFDGGVSAIEVRATLGRIELDHVQYGNMIPAPGALALLGLAGLARRRSRRRLT